MAIDLLALAVVPASAQVGLGMAPMRVELQMAAGQQYSGSLNLSNTSGDKMRIRAELLDFYIDQAGTSQFAREFAQEAAYSCRKWLSLNPMEMEVEESGHLPIRYTIQVPPNTPTGSYNCAGGFTTLPPAQHANGTGMRFAVRVVVAFYVVVGKPAREGGLREIKLEYVPAAPQPGEAKGKQASAEASKGSWAAVVVLENRGLMYFRPQGEFALLGENGDVVERVEFPSLAVLPKREQRFVFPLKTDVQGGTFTLRAMVDIGTGEVQRGSVIVTKAAQ